MSTRCLIEIWDGGREYKIYRHCDGYPDGVLGDINKIKHLLGDPEYFLAEFIFLAKYNMVRRGYNWRKGYGVCTHGCRHGDLAYRYILYRNGREWCIIIRKKEYLGNGLEAWEDIFHGKLDEAIEKFVKHYKDGCHIKEIPR